MKWSVISTISIMLQFLDEMHFGSGLFLVNSIHDGVHGVEIKLHLVQQFTLRNGEYLADHPSSPQVEA